MLALYLVHANLERIDAGHKINFWANYIITLMVILWFEVSIYQNQKSQVKLFVKIKMIEVQ